MLKFRRKRQNSLVKLRIEHYSRDGKLKRVIEKEGDRVLDNWGAFLRMIFTPVDVEERAYCTGFVNMAGTATRVRTGWDASCWDYAYTAEKKFYVCMGTGSTPPTNTDYKLESLVASTVASIKSLELLDTVIRLTIGGSIRAPSNVTIWEIGVFLRCPSDESAPDNFLMFRDVLSEGIEMLSGEYLSVYYTIEFTR